jgi:hypothetical protein
MCHCASDASLREEVKREQNHLISICESMKGSQRGMRSGKSSAECRSREILLIMFADMAKCVRQRQEQQREKFNVLFSHLALLFYIMQHWHA